jgi:hypothetical protein
VTANVVNRLVVAVGIGAVALFGLSVPAAAQGEHGQGQQQDQKERKQQGAKKNAPQDQQRQQHLPPQDQQARIHEQQQRLTQYGAHLDQQQRAAQPHSVQLRQQNRTAQYSFQQQYVARLRQQQVRVQGQAGYNYGRDPYFFTPPSYRYSRGGRYYETNQYGVDLLRQAVNYGYQEGCRAGMADRQDRWRADYESSYAYQDANYGYSGFYVDRDDYNTYFREGFRRGYEDGYNNRYRYGSYSNGRATILGAVLGAILTFEAIR